MRNVMEMAFKCLNHRKENEPRSDSDGEDAAEIQISHIRGVLGGNVAGRNQTEVDQKALNKAFFHFIKLIYETASYKKKYLADGKQGPVRCLACSRSSANFSDTHALIIHAYKSKDSIVDHLAFLKSLCILMGWNYAIPPNDLKAYQNFSAEEAENIRGDLVIWPSIVLVYSTTSARKDEKDAGFSSCKSSAMYLREGHTGIYIVKFSHDEAGLKEAFRMANYFKRWKHISKDGKRPILFEKNWEVCYGNLCTVTDLEKLTYELRRGSV